MRVSAGPAFSNRRSNPYNALLYDALVARGVDVVEFAPGTVRRQHPDLVHLHWPESPLNKPRRAAAAYRSMQLLWVLAMLRARGTRVVWTVHNLRSHFQRYPRAERVWWWLFTGLLTGWTALSRDGAEAAMGAHRRLRALPFVVIPHGHYRDAYVRVPRAEGRRRLGLTDERLLTFVGRVKPYKGVPALLDAFTTIEAPTWRLVVAGRCDDEKLAQQLRSQSNDSRITVRLEELPDDDVALLLSAADLVVLPFREVLNSGSALLALSLDVPVLVPRRGAMAELHALAPAWVSTYDGELTADVLRDAAERERPPGRPDLSVLDWPDIASETETFYRSQLERHDARR